jgi:hypothetical protein
MASAAHRCAAEHRLSITVLQDYTSYTECSISDATQTTTHEQLHAQNDETNANIEFLHQYPVVAVDALLDIGTVVVLAGLWLDEQLSQTNASCVPKLCCMLSYSVLPCQDTHC